MDTQRIEGMMIDMDLSYEVLEEGTWMIEDDLAHIDNIIVKYLEPIILFRVKVMSVPKENKEEFFQKLLELNATGLLHGAYAVEGDNVVILNTLQSETLDKAEFQSTIESIEYALVEHYDTLSKYC